MEVPFAASKLTLQLLKSPISFEEKQHGIKEYVLPVSTKNDFCEIISLIKINELYELDKPCKWKPECKVPTCFFYLDNNMEEYI